MENLRPRLHPRLHPRPHSLPRIPKLLLSSDELGHYAYSQLTEDKFFHKYQIQAIVKNGVKFNEIIAKIINLTRNYTKKDFVIIYGGKNDCAEYKNIDRINLLNILENMGHTNVIILSTPLWYRKNTINSFVYFNNHLLQESCELFSWAHFFDVNIVVHELEGDRFVIKQLWHKDIFLQILYQLSVLILTINFDKLSISKNSVMDKYLHKRKV